MVRTTSLSPLLVLVALLCSSMTRGSSPIGISLRSSTIKTTSSSLPWRRLEDSALTLDQHNETHDDDHAWNETDHAEEGDDHEHESSSNSSNNDNKPWAEVIITSFIINLVTLVGVIVVTGEFVAKQVFKRDVHHSPIYNVFTHNAVPSFACGALLATTVFLVLPESLALITSHFAGEAGHEGHRRSQEEEENTEGAIVWRFGACVIGGFLLPVLTSMIFPHSHDEAAAAALGEKTEIVMADETDKLRDSPQETVVIVEDIKEDSVKDGAADNMNAHSHALSSQETGGLGDVAESADLVVTTEDNKALPYDIDYPLAASILAGDFFHNFADGIFVGTAFMLCSREIAITLSAATIYHEIAQEIADYFVLTRFCNIPPGKALLINFLSGFSVLLGACFIVGINDISDVVIGSILGVSGGVYIYISVAECFPRAKAAQKTFNDKLISFSAFLFGVIPIALVLMNHGHCDVSHAD